MHLPVLKQEVLKYLDPKSDQNFIDCTAGEGGHSLAILEKIKPGGKILAIDRDESNIEILKKKNFKNLITIEGNYCFLEKIIRKENFKKISGVLFDLGMSSRHPDESGRGFSFRKNEPLDMRYSSQEKGITAWEIINQWPREDLEEIFKKYVEERLSKIIAQRIFEKRKKKTRNTTFDLIEIIQESIPNKFKGKKIHPATKVFQALRITVNQELENLKEVLPQAIEILEKEGKVVVISFHSLEDRIVKHFFKEKFKEGQVKILTKKPVIAGVEEIKNNPRSRSAKLRVVQKIDKNEKIIFKKE